MAVQWRGSVRAAGVLVALATTVALAGCAGEPGAAAVVDGTAIPTSDVQAALVELAPYFQGVTTTNVLAVLVQEPTVVALADEKGVGVSDEDAQQLLDSVVRAEGEGRDRGLHGAVVGGGQVLHRLHQPAGPAGCHRVGEEIDTRLRALDVEVNPRFGSLTDDNQVADPTTAPWMVKATAPAPTDGATPEPTPTPSAS